MKIITLLALYIQITLVNAEVIRFSFDKSKELSAVSLEIEKDGFKISILGQVELVGEGYKISNVQRIFFKSGSIVSNVRLGSITSSTVDGLSSVYKLDKQILVKEVLIDRKEEEFNVYLVSADEVFSLKPQKDLKKNEVLKVIHPQLKTLSFILAKDKAPKQEKLAK